MRTRTSHHRNHSIEHSLYPPHLNTKPGANGSLSAQTSPNKAMHPRLYAPTKLKLLYLISVNRSIKSHENDYEPDSLRVSSLVSSLSESSFLHRPVASGRIARSCGAAKIDEAF